MDGRKNNGAKPGGNPGAGRKAKADEIKLIERLSPMDDTALNELKKGIKAGDFQFIKLFMDYRFGKPKERVDVTSDGEKINSIQVEVIRTLNESKAKD